MTDDDLELLKRAAKAAGLPVDFRDTSASSSRIDYWIDPDGPYWNPLKSDGDALRLAVKLRIHLEFEESCVSPNTDTAVYRSGPYGDDPAAATRRAIVRAAAALGLEKDRTAP